MMTSWNVSQLNNNVLSRKEKKIEKGCNIFMNVCTNNF